MAKENTIDTNEEAVEFSKRVCEVAAEKLDGRAADMRLRGMPTLADRMRNVACDLRTLAREIGQAEPEA